RRSASRGARRNIRATAALFGERIVARRGRPGRCDLELVGARLTDGGAGDEDAVDAVGGDVVLEGGVARGALAVVVVELLGAAGHLEDEVRVEGRRAEVHHDALAGAADEPVAVGVFAGAEGAVAGGERPPFGAGG